uniref:PPM-type phosphatase domain-containing protein n=1 Tax=Amphiprion ocellaris TaxID=80972 RepID=A0AAQ5YN51_AMPOC
INDRGYDDPAVPARSDHALFSAQTGDPVPAVHQPGSVELLLPHGRSEDHRQVQPGCGQDGQGESGRDDAERAVRRAGRPGRGVRQDLGVEEQQRGRVLHPRPARPHGGPVRGARRHRQQEPPVYFWDLRWPWRRGTTCLVALLSDKELTVANVGDSRGVLCDKDGNAIPLSHDHKPYQLKERKRIKKAGGFISFNGSWRVQGILAMSRSLGDYPLKNLNVVIPDPDIMSFDLNKLQPEFMILASDGLWDTFSNEEAVRFIRERLDEPHFGAKSIVLQSFYRGCPDNITVMVVKFKGKTNEK